MIENDILIKVHKSYRMVVAICDADLKGEKFIEGEKQLDLSTGFFEGESLKLDELKARIIDCVTEDATFYIVGENSINLAKELSVIGNDGVGEIAGVKYALILL